VSLEPADQKARYMAALKLDSELSPHHVVLSISVTGGFLGGTRLEFADGLNCLIGGRGAGKTTALEFVRFGLGLMPDPKTSLQRHRTIDSLVKANLSTGRLSIELQTKTGMRYTAGRGANESVQVLNEAGTAVPISLDRDQIFGADVFSQNEIEEISSSPAAQLELLDRFREQEAVKIARDLEQLKRQLDQSPGARGDGRWCRAPTGSGATTTAARASRRPLPWESASSPRSLVPPVRGTP
jgi:hypothetical protein